MIEKIEEHKSVKFTNAEKLLEKDFRKAFFDDLESLPSMY